MTESAEKDLKFENALQQRIQTAEMGKAPTQALANAFSLNYSQEISKLENVSKPSAKPVEMGKAPTQATATTSSLNLKLLLIIFVVAGLLGVGLLYYHSSSKQDDSSLESCIAKTT